jgi:hypothetical protein
MGIPVKEIRDEQNFPLAIAAGLIAALIGAAIWTGATIATNSKLGLVAIFIGFIVGKAVNITGKGVDQKFGILGALCGLLGCVLGDLSSDIAFYAQLHNMSFSYVLEHLNVDFLVALVNSFFKPMDLAFYGIAVYEGYKFSFKYRMVRKPA